MTRAAPTDSDAIKPPVIVDENGSLIFFRSVPAAQSYLEPIDVINGEYVAYDAVGRAIGLVVETETGTGVLGRLGPPIKTVKLRGGLVASDGGEELRGVLHRFLEEVDASPDQLSSPPLSELLSLAMKNGDVR
jgi:hypothetical protein